MPPMESLHFTIMLLPSLCGALILSHQSQKLALHGQRSDSTHPNPPCSGFEVNPALGRVWSHESLCRQWGLMRICCTGREILRVLIAQDSSSWPCREPGSAQGHHPLSRELLREHVLHCRGCSWWGCTARTALSVSPEAPWHSVPVIKDYVGPTDSSITLLASPHSIPARIKAPYKGEES